MMSIARIMAKIISAASAANKTAATAGIDPTISPIVTANRTDSMNIMMSIQHLFFLCFTPL